MSMFISFRHYNYRLWFISNFVASIATWMQRVAQDWAVLVVLTNHSGVAVGITTALQFLPQLLFGVHAGVIADRFDRRKVLQLSQSFIAICAVLTAFLLISNTAHLYHIYILAFLTGTAAAIASPARQAFVGELVPDCDLPNAVAFNSAAFNGARLVGPAVAGLVIAVVGPGYIFAINAIIYLIPIFTLIMMRSAELLVANKVAKEPGQIMEGIRYVKNRSDIIAIILIVTVVGALGLNFQLTQAVMATQVFHKGAGEYGILGSIMAIGSLSGSLTAAKHQTPRVSTVIISTFGFGFFAALAAIAPNYGLFAISLIPVGLCSIILITSANAAIQISTEPQLRGRVLAIYSMFFLGGTPIGAPTVGWVAEHMGPRWSIGVGAFASMGISIIVAIWLWRHWDINLQWHLHRPFLEMEGPRERAAAQMLDTGFEK